MESGLRPGSSGDKQPRLKSREQKNSPKKNLNMSHPSSQKKRQNTKSTKAQLHPQDVSAQPTAGEASNLDLKKEIKEIMDILGSITRNQKKKLLQTGQSAGVEPSAQDRSAE